MTALPALRDYQARAVQQARACFAAGHRRVLLRGPTGSGKTVVFCHIIGSAAAKGSGTLVLAHRRELIQQASARLDREGIDHGVIMAQHWRQRPAVPVQVASVQTMRTRRGAMSGRFRFIVVDEAHHAPADSYLGVLADNPDAYVLGVTATPYRSDGRGLGSLFSTMVNIATVGELVDQGYLVPPRPFAPSKPDLAGIHLRRGDYDEGELAERCDRSELVGDIVTHWHKLAAGRPTICFAVNLAHSKHIVRQFQAAGVPAEHLDGTTPADARDAILARLACGATKVVSNVGVLTEGTDIPCVSAIILARPTKSQGLYVQCAGRGLRLDQDKGDCIILDHAGLTYEHGSLLDEPEVDLQEGVRKRRRDGPMLRLTTCLQCYAVYRPGQACPNCGWLPVVKPPQPREGELQEVQADRARIERAREVGRANSLADLRAIAKERGYKPAWADHVWRGRLSKRNVA